MGFCGLEWLSESGEVVLLPAEDGLFTGAVGLSSGVACMAGRDVSSVRLAWVRVGATFFAEGADETEDCVFLFSGVTAGFLETAGAWAEWG